MESSVDYIYDINCTECKSDYADGTGSLTYNGADDTSTCKEHEVKCPPGEGLFDHTSGKQGTCKTCGTNFYNNANDNSVCAKLKGGILNCNTYKSSCGEKLWS